MPYVTHNDNDHEISIHYEIIGRGEPIVFHHGNGNCINDWHTLGYVDALARDFQLILIDSRGYGKSSKLHDPKAYSLRSRAKDSITVLDQLGIDKAHCLGGSIGASMCMILARFYQQHFKSYIFATPYFELFDDEVQQALLNGPDAYLAKLEALVGSRIANETIRQTLLANDTKAVWAANTSEWFDYHDYVQYIKVPSLIYVGSKEPSVAALKELAQQIPQAQLHIFPDADHCQIYWGGPLAAPVIRDFLIGLSR